MGRVVAMVVAALILAMLGGLADEPSSADSMDRQGPHWWYTHRSVGVPAIDSVLAVEDAATSGGSATVWALDLGTGRWHEFAHSPGPVVPVGLLAYVEQQGAAYAVPLSPGGVQSITIDTRQWRTLPAVFPRPVSVTDVATDTRRGRILAWSDWDDEMWTYDPERNTWKRAVRKAPWPESGIPGGGQGYTLLTYDRAADRAVLAVLPVPGRSGATWLFAPATGTWTRGRSVPAPLVLGYGEWGTESVYDPVHRRSVLYSRGVVETFDSGRDRWFRPSNAGWPGIEFGPDPGLADFGGANPWPDGQPLGVLARGDHQLVVDERRGRVILLGGSALFHVSGPEDPANYQWRPVSEVWAYDVGANTWIRVR